MPASSFVLLARIPRYCREAKTAFFLLSVSRDRTHMPGLLLNHVAVVTGAGSGIGRAIALGFAREGAKVAALDINGDTAEQTTASIRATGGMAEAFTVDIADRTACAAAAADVARRMGPVSVLVNDAGINRRTPFTGEPAAVIKDWDDIMAINLNGMFNVTQTFLATLRATKGRIVNVASVQSFAHMRTPNSAAYTTAKHGVLGFTRALAAELGKDGVRVNAVGPGLIETPLNEQARAKNPDIARLSVERTPLGRTGQPEDVVGPAIFLASDLAGYVTGTIIMVDGGYRTT
jgi:NAD(P)-dependent dehydrogenase (short-subunit alcohol dehydrogenase family)